MRSWLASRAPNLHHPSEPVRNGVRSDGMPTYMISVLNDEFCVENEEEHADASLAIHEAIKGALAVGAEQILSGKNFFGAEVSVSDGNSRERFVVALGANRLK